MSTRHLWRHWRRAAVLIVAILLVLSVWAFWWEPRRLLVSSHRLELPGWQQPLRVAVLTDLHVGSPHNGLDKLDRIINRTMQAQPDVVVLLGDFVIQGIVGGSFVSPEQIAKRLQRVRAPLGVYAVLGNHDWWLDAESVRGALVSANIVVLEDSAQRIRWPGSPAPRDAVAGASGFWIGGVSDFWEGRHDVAKAVASISDDAPTLLITHNPDIFPDVPARIALTIAGHTHGGQVKLPFIGAPIVPSRYGQRFTEGYIVEQGRRLFVATGTGMSILPVRFRVPPRIVLLELVPG